LSIRYLVDCLAASCQLATSATGYA